MWDGFDGPRWEVECVSLHILLDTNDLMAAPAYKECWEIEVSSGCPGRRNEWSTSSSF